MNNSRWLNTTETAKLLSISPITARRWTDKGLLECTKTAGGHRRYSAATIEALAKKQKREVQAKADEFNCGPMQFGTEDHFQSATPPYKREANSRGNHSEADFYNRVNMASTVLKLNLTIASAINSVEEEVDRVHTVISSTLDIATLSTELPEKQREKLADHVDTLVTGLQYQDLFNQRLQSVKAALDNINMVFKASLSDYNKTQLNGFKKELERSNVRLNQNIVASYINNLISDDTTTVELLESNKNINRDPELFS